MASTNSLTSLELHSLATSAGMLELSLIDVAVPEPGDNEVVVEIGAEPINPSDLALLLGPADVSTGTIGGTPQRPTFTASIPCQYQKVWIGVEARPRPNDSYDVEC